MIPLPKMFKRDGFDFELVHRNDGVAMLRKTKRGETRTIESWEVVKLDRVKAKTFPNGISTPAHEAMPSSESWGQSGWTFTNQEEAFKKFIALSP